MRKLILTADDYGLNKDVNDAVIQSVRNRTVTSVQVLANMATEDEIKTLAKAIHESGDNCGIGLHFCTTVGPSMIKRDASFTKWDDTEKEFVFRDIRDWKYRKESDADMKAELNMQFDKLSDLIGAHRVDSLSSHQNIHLFHTDYMKMVKDISVKAKIPVRSPLRWEQDKGNRTYKDGIGLAPISGEAAATFLESLKHLSTINLLKNGLFPVKMRNRRNIIVDEVHSGGCPNSMCGHWFGQPSMEAMTWMVSELENMEKPENKYCTELLMHLSMSEFGDIPGQNYNMASRKKEYQELNKPEMVEYIDVLHKTGIIQLGSYRKVLHGTDVSFADFAV